MIGRDTLLSLVPHAGAMCLLEEVESWSRTAIVCVATRHGDPRHPLRHGDRLSAIHLIEYGAQAMAVHGGLLARDAGRAPPSGLLVSARNVVLHAERLDDITEKLLVTATALAVDPRGWTYAFEVRTQARVLAGGRLAVLLDGASP
ncbi:MAG TPA: hypothetical protein VJM11_11890 [Nevskiaceae bacterium]|nr:hypothetical protein [Nevskiaceae bacterium]